MNVDQKLLETVFLIDICRQSGDKWESKNPVSNDYLSTFVDRLPPSIQFEIKYCSPLSIEQLK